jgi:heptosyltransferase-3
MRILIYRLGSIGDFVISLPCLHFMRRQYPNAEIRLLTNRSAESRAAEAASVLEGSGLIDGYMTYPLGTRNPRELNNRAREIRRFKPDLFIYLASRRSRIDIYRDFAYFRYCGVRHAIGFPFASDLLESNYDPTTGLWESEAHRLTRTLAKAGVVDCDHPENWDLGLSSRELSKAKEILLRGFQGTSPTMPLFGISPGTKQPIKDWGAANWSAVLRNLGKIERGLVVIGAKDEWMYAEHVLRAWQGPVLNLCGRTSPRVAAAVIKNLSLFLCHDSGPMHLASTVGTRCVAVFSTLNLPGQWYPFGPGHKIFYPPNKTDSIQVIGPNDVADATMQMLMDEDMVRQTQTHHVEGLH